MDRSKKDFAMYRLEKSRDCILAAEHALSYDDYNTATNRSYYAVFHAIRSILALDGVDYKHHSAVASHFRHYYVKTGIFDVKYSDILRDLFDARGGSDYDDFYVISKERTKQQIEAARDFLEAVDSYIKNRLME